MARPTKYLKKYCDDIVAYFDKPLTHVVKKDSFKNGVKVQLEVEKVTDLPTFERFAHEIGVTVSTMWEWEKAHDEFSKACNRARALQEQLIVGNAMAGRYVGPFAQFYLKNKYSYADKTEVDHTTKGQPMPLLGGTTPLLDNDGLQADDEPAQDSEA